MTNIELIRMLIKHPPEAKVFAFDPEVMMMAQITGCVSGPDPVRIMENPPEPIYRIELQTDTPF